MRPTGSAADLERRRIRAVELIEQGESPDDVAHFLGCGRSSVYTWVTLARQAPEQLQAIILTDPPQSYAILPWARATTRTAVTGTARPRRSPTRAGPPRPTWGSSPNSAKTYGSVFSAMLTPQIDPPLSLGPMEGLGVGFCRQSRRVSES
jgi:hypothetical protein